MKEGWKYCRLGDVCTIERGGSPRPIETYITNAENGLNWIKIGDAQEGSKYILTTKEKIKPEGLKKTRLVHIGDFILSNSMSFGHPYILGIDGCIHDGWLVIHDDKGTFNKSYLYYVLGSPNMYNEFKRLAVGGVVNNLNSQLVRNVVVPIPPLPEQERIVAELDLLSGIIDKQKAQLGELDILAQSIFYDMFGDPVENEKGWIVKELGKVLKTTSGGTPSKGHPEYYENGNIPWVNSGDLHQMFIYDTPKHITQTGVDNSSAKLFPIDTCLIAMYGATVGEVSILKIQSTTNQAVCGIFPSKDYLPIFLYSTLKYSKKYFVELASGGAQPNISQGIIKKFDLISPPLSLQQSFDQKIQSIESQKESINRSIAETQKLFNYTMDKYFG